MEMEMNMYSVTGNKDENIVVTWQLKNKKQKH